MEISENFIGEVYKGIWQGATVVAMKKLKVAHNIEKLSEEAAVLSILRHPNIVQFYGLYLDQNNFCYLVTEYCSAGKKLIKIHENSEKFW